MKFAFLLCSLLAVTSHAKLKLPKHVKESLVFIESKRTGHGENLRRSVGSGVVVISDNRGTYIVSAKHVCNKALKETKSKHGVAIYNLIKFKKIVNKKLSSKFYVGQILKVDPNSDLCLIYSMHRNFTPTKISFTMPRLSEKLYSYSNPGYQVGVLSTGKLIKPAWLESQALYHTSVEIAPGSSGGGLYNYRHELVGINALTQYDGTSYAVPSPILEHFLSGIK